MWLWYSINNGTGLWVCIKLNKKNQPHHTPHALILNADIFCLSVPPIPASVIASHLLTSFFYNQNRPVVGVIVAARRGGGWLGPKPIIQSYILCWFNSLKDQLRYVNIICGRDNPGSRFRSQQRRRPWVMYANSGNCLNNHKQPEAKNVRASLVGVFGSACGGGWGIKGRGFLVPNFIIRSVQL